MANKIKRHHSKRKLTIPMAVVAGFLPTAWQVKQEMNRPGSSLFLAVKTVGSGLIGYDNINQTWKGWNQAQAYGASSILAGFAIHWVANKVGINRVISQAGIPFIRI